MKKQAQVLFTEEEAKAGMVLMQKVLSHVPSYVEQQAAKFAREPRPSYGQCGSLNPQGFSLLKRDPTKRREEGENYAATC